MHDLPRALDDPEQAAHAWRRFRRILRWMLLPAGLASAGALRWLAASYGPLGWMTVAATVFGVAGSVMMAAALMGLAFLSSGTGHDANVAGHDGS